MTNSKAQFNNTYVIGVIIQGTIGEVRITKMNTKSFRYEGSVKLLKDNTFVPVKGVAKFWKDSKDGTQAFYKSGSAVLTINK